MMICLAILAMLPLTVFVLGVLAEMAKTDPEMIGGCIFSVILLAMVMGFFWGFNTLYIHFYPPASPAGQAVQVEAQSK